MEERKRRKSLAPIPQFSDHVKAHKTKSWESKKGKKDENLLEIQIPKNLSPTSLSPTSLSPKKQSPRERRLSLSPRIVSPRLASNFIGTAFKSCVKKLTEKEEEEIIFSREEEDFRTDEYSNIQTSEESKKNPKKRQRELIILEILKTEEQYIEDLKILIENFLEPIQNMDNIPKEKSFGLFGGVQQILIVNETMFKKLKKRYENREVKEMLIGDIFENFVSLK